MSAIILTVLHQVANDMNTFECQLSPNFPSLPLITATVWQATSCVKIFELGSHRPTHGKTTTSPANCGTAGRGHGSSKATRCQKGRHLDRVRCSGSMGNASRCSALTPSQRLMFYPFCSRVWEECPLVRQPLQYFLLENLWCLPVPQSSKRSRL